MSFQFSIPIRLIHTILTRTTSTLIFALTSWIEIYMNLDLDLEYKHGIGYEIAVADDVLHSWRRHRNYVITTNPDLPFTMRSVKRLIPMPIAWRSNQLVAVTLITKQALKFDNNFVLKSLRTTVLHRKIISFSHRSFIPVCFLRIARDVYVLHRTFLICNPRAG